MIKLRSSTALKYQMMWDWIVSLDVAKNYESCAYICIGLYKQLEIITCVITITRTHKGNKD